MSRGKKALIGLAVAAAAWTAALQHLSHSTGAGLPSIAAESPSRGKSFSYYAVLLSPLIFTVVFGIYAVATVAWQTAHVEQKNEAAAALEKDLRKAKAGLEKLGFDTSCATGR